GRVDGGGADEPPLPLWLPRKELGEPLSPEARNLLAERQDEEHRRLLYVAITRAEDRLYIRGRQGRRAAPEACCYKLDEARPDSLGEPVDFDFSGLLPEGWAGPGRRLATTQRAEPRTPENRAAGPRRGGGLPDWVQAAAPAEAEPPQPLAPSRPSQPEP